MEVNQVSEAAWSVDIRIVAALIGVVAFVVSQVANAWFVARRDSKQKEQEKRDIALFALAELVNVKRHQEANMVKLRSILESDRFGDKIDYDKFKLSDNGLVALDLAKVYVLEASLAQDLLRFSLFCRNNELEIENTFSVVSSAVSDDEKNAYIKRLSDRLGSTIKLSSEISAQIESYARSPKKYEGKAVYWPDTLFKLRK